MNLTKDQRPMYRPIKCVVHFLDNSQASFEVDKREPAQCLFDKVFEHLEIREKEYFGLQFTDTTSSTEDNDTVFKLHSSEVVRWLDPSKSIKKQVKLLSPYEFSFRVKYYVLDPSCMKHEYTRYHLFLQLTKDTVEGRLVAPYNISVLLASYAVQSELGDYSIEEHGLSSAYLSEFTFVPDQTLAMLEDVAVLHRKHRGMSPATCEMLYIDTARCLPTYGIQFYKAKWDQVREGESEVELGVACTGLVLFKDSRKIHSFNWSQIVKISFKRRQFFVHLRKDLTMTSDIPPSTTVVQGTSADTSSLFGFSMSSYRCCKSLWRSCVEHHTFFSQLQQQHAASCSGGCDMPATAAAGYSNQQFSHRSLSDRPSNRPVSIPPSINYQAHSTAYLPPHSNSLTSPAPQSLLNRSLDSSNTADHRHYAQQIVRYPNSSRVRKDTCDSGPMYDGLVDGINNEPGFNTAVNTQQLARYSNTSGPGRVRLGEDSCDSAPLNDARAENIGGYYSRGGLCCGERNSDSGIGSSMIASISSNGNTNGGADSIYNTRPISNHTVNNSLDSDSSLVASGRQSVNGSISNTSMLLGESNSLSRRDGAVLRPSSCTGGLLGGRGDDFKRGEGVEARNTIHISTTWRGPGARTIPCRPHSGIGAPGVDRAVTGQVERKMSNLSEPSSDDESSSCYRDGYHKDDRCVGGEMKVGSVVYNTPSSLSASIISQSDRSPTEHIYDLPNNSSLLSTSLTSSTYNNDSSSSHDIITIRMKPDSRGTFGFNVKGGTDQQLPIVVSRVAPGSPADLSSPRLTEGYQVLFINGRDVSQHTHAQVVQFIKAARETHSGELILVVRPNVALLEDSPSEPDYHYTPDQSTSSSKLHPLSGSIAMLKESLAAGAAVPAFETVYRKKPGMTMNTAVLAENIARNRYRDILPYDQTRVKLNSTAHDYINANYVKMEIKGSGVVNRYIAAQGPLPETLADFWSMVWEQRSTLIVMLTTLVERGRVKCHRYWPDLGTTAKYGDLLVECVSEEKCRSFEYRDFVISKQQERLDDSTRDTEAERDKAIEDRRHIHQMQYLSWPDHGVPDDSSDFLQFVQRVRNHRAGVVEPIIVHCSAGIGRTGVLIAMETCMCMIEANQPIDLLDIVRNMREQRAMLIQTSDQYKFVCGALVRVYDEKIVEPIQDLKR